MRTTQKKKKRDDSKRGAKESAQGAAANKSEWITTPVLRNLISLFTDPLTPGPVIIHMTSDEWKEMSRGIRTSQKKIGKDAKGLIVIPDPFGGYLGFLACAAGSKAGSACIPEVISSDRTIHFGQGCSCIS